MLLNGQVASEITLHDRGLAYGDGLFETVLVVDGRPVLLDLHLTRLLRGCERLGLQPDLTALDREIHSLLNNPPAEYTPLPARCVLKLILTRQAGGRGYRPARDGTNRILSLHPAPGDAQLHAEQGIGVFLCRQTLARQSTLAGLKHLNRLEQVLASREWPGSDVQEGLMCDTEGLLIEGTRSNVFLVRQGQLLTPSLQRCGVDGVLRRHLLAAWSSHVEVCDIPLEWLADADEVFVCNSVFGVWPVIDLQLASVSRSLAIGPHARAACAIFQQVSAHAG